MHMFKKGRKAKDQYDAQDNPNGFTASLKSSMTTKRKGKKGAITEEKPQLDLSTALPEMEDFRTSLLMTGLSARFSMLREQDDPSSKIGKASDDSVLFPKRASRLNLFGHHTQHLGDIAEVESIRSSIRPPFADKDRASSVGGADGYESDGGGSVMSRARPGEGNNLFGGRQKLYKVTTAASTATTPGTPDGSGVERGKHMYESDVSLSLFQQHRLKEREARKSEDDNMHRRSPDSDDASLSATFNANRGTQSSTTSGLRTSTAATSIVSDSPIANSGGGPTPSTSVKAAEEAPYSPTDNYRPAVSPTSRITRNGDQQAIQRLGPSKSAASIRDRYQRTGGYFTPASLRPTSPPMISRTTHALDSTVRDRQNGTLSPSLTSPTSPTWMARKDEMLASSVRANDRGKATALGLFNKPAREFDEQQYLQRQMKMHEGRNSPFSSASRSASRASEEAQSHAPSGPGPAISNSSPIPPDASTAPAQVSLPSSKDNATSDRSTSKASETSSRTSAASSDRRSASRPRAKSSATSRDNVKARLETLIRRQNEELVALEAAKLGPERSPPPEDAQSTFFDNDDSSVDEERSRRKSSKTNSIRMPDGTIHPAFRKSLSSTSLHTQSAVPEAAPGLPDLPTSSNAPSTSLEVPGASGIGLSGLIRSHLRQESDASIMPPPSPGLPAQQSRSDERGQEVSIAVSHDASDRAWANSEQTPQPLTPTTMMSMKAQQVLRQAMALRDVSAAAPDDRRATSQSHVPAPTSTTTAFTVRAQQHENELTHRREESTETARDRREFDEQLAERRMKVQRGLKDLPERDISAAVVAPPPPQVQQMAAFAEPDYGIGSRRGPPHHETRRYDEYRARELHSRNGNYRKNSDQSFDSGSRTANSSRSGHRDDYSDRGHDPRSTTPSSSRTGYRDRSNSGATDRSKNRPRQYRDEPPVPGASLSNPSSPYDIIHPATEMHLGARPDFRSAHGPASSSASAATHARATPRPSPISPTSSNLDYMQTSSFGRGRTTPTLGSGRTTPSSGRKRSGTKTLISEPTFISSTSDVPLIPLPSGPVYHEAAQQPPPLPHMNPRRLGANSERSSPAMHNQFSPRTPLEPVPGSPMYTDFAPDSRSAAPTAPRERRKLRKSSSEGGNMAARAKQQAMADTMKGNLLNTPVPNFPNRSFTALGVSEGGMF